MTGVGTADVRIPPDLLARVALGERIVITEQGKPVAVLKNATYLASGLKMGSSQVLPRLAAVPPGLTQTVVPDCMSRRKMSVMWLVSPGTRSLAALANAT